jgi:ribonuclease P protein component
MAPKSSFSFQKNRRLRYRAEYEHVRREGMMRHGRLLMLNVAPVENCGLSRAGFVTSRRIGGAVVRNRVRRCLREIVRQHQHEVREGFWFVFIAKSGAVNASYRSLEDEWLHLARRASILL